MKVGSLHMGLTDKTVLLSQRCPVKINCNKERVVEWIRRNQWEIIIFIHNLYNRLIENDRQPFLEKNTYYIYTKRKPRCSYLQRGFCEV